MIKIESLWCQAFYTKRLNTNKLNYKLSNNLVKHEHEIDKIKQSIVWRLKEEWFGLNSKKNSNPKVWLQLNDSIQRRTLSTVCISNIVPNSKKACRLHESRQIKKREIIYCQIFQHQHRESNALLSHNRRRSRTSGEFYDWATKVDRLTSALCNRWKPSHHLATIMSFSLTFQLFFWSIKRDRDGIRTKVHDLGKISIAFSLKRSLTNFLRFPFFQPMSRDKHVRFGERKKLWISLSKVSAVRKEWLLHQHWQALSNWNNAYCSSNQTVGHTIKVKKMC